MMWIAIKPFVWIFRFFILEPLRLASWFVMCALIILVNIKYMDEFYDIDEWLEYTKDKKETEWHHQVTRTYVYKSRWHYLLNKEPISIRSIARA